MANDNMKEEISALMDGEVDQPQMQQLMRQLRNDPECCDCWEQYHLIGDAMRNSLPPQIDRSFVNNISQAVAKEDLPAPTVKPQAAQPPKRPGVANPWTGFALAASVAAVAYLGVGLMTQEEQGLAPRIAGTEPASAPAPLARNQPLPSSDIRTVRSQQQWNVGQPAVESRLNNYLLSHRNVAGSTAMSPTVLPNARLVVTQPLGDE